MFGWTFLADVNINPNMESKDSAKKNRSITNWILTFFMLLLKSIISIIIFLRGSFLSWNKKPVILYRVYCRIRNPPISLRAITKPRIKFHY